MVSGWKSNFKINFLTFTQQGYGYPLPGRFVNRGNWYYGSEQFETFRLCKHGVGNFIAIKPLLTPLTTTDEISAHDL
jgi:hypothetical protein